MEMKHFTHARRVLYFSSILPFVETAFQVLHITLEIHLVEKMLSCGKRLALLGRTRSTP